MKKEHPVRSKEHWEMTYHSNPNCAKDGAKTARVVGSQFDPMEAKKRMTTYVKTNEQDH